MKITIEVDCTPAEARSFMGLPDVEPFVLPEATHLLQIQNPRGMAEGLAAFFARHSLSASP